MNPHPRRQVQNPNGKLFERVKNIVCVSRDVAWGIWVCLYHAQQDFMKWLVPRAYYKSLSGHIALVTGGASGIGRLISHKLAKLGVIVIIWDVNERGGQDAAEAIIRDGGIAFSYAVDLGSREAIYIAAQRLQAEVGDVTLLINNAGIVFGKTFLNSKDEDILKTFDVNILAHFWTIKAFLPKMIVRNKGHIVNIASMAGFCGTSRLVDYCASKFAAVGLDEALRAELHDLNLSEHIKTTLICPYYINTGMFAGVRSKVAPILDPEYVANETVVAIRTQKELVILPWWLSIFVNLKYFLPISGHTYMARALGFSNSMENFSL